MCIRDRDNPVSGGLDTVEELNNMYVHIENHDRWSADSFRVDYVVVQVTHN